MSRFALFVFLMFIGCQSIQAERETMITEKSCQVAIQLTKQSLAIYRNGGDQFQVMVMLDNYNTNGDPEAFAGKVLTQLYVIDLMKNVKRAFRDQEILKKVTSNCTKQLGLKMHNSRYKTK